MRKWTMRAAMVLAVAGMMSAVTGRGFSARAQPSQGEGTATSPGIDAPAPPGGRTTRVVVSQSKGPVVELPKMIGKPALNVGGPSQGIDRDVVWDKVCESGEGYFTEIETWRRQGAVIKKYHKRLTLIEGVLVRERCTVEEPGARGARTFATHMWGHHAGPDFAGQRKYAVHTDGMEKLQQARRGRGFFNPKDPIAACDLDDPKKVTDEELERYAPTVWRAYWEDQPVFIVHRQEESEFWRGRRVMAEKRAYGKNPDSPSIPPYNTWRTYRRVQAVTEKGDRRTDAGRVVRFSQAWYNSFAVFDVVQVMDYQAKPAPKIKSYEITHYVYYSSPEVARIVVLEPGQCKDYQVEIETVEDGDPAMRGEWIKNVVATGPAYEEAKQGRGKVFSESRLDRPSSTIIIRGKEHTILEQQPVENPKP